MEEIKERMVNYWSERAPKFSELRIREFYSGKKALWLEELHKYLPDKKGLNILDIGTGSGFFCFLLGEMGHHVTGIDLTEEMIREARKTSRDLGIQADFYIMDGETPEFEDNSFDVIVSRNLTWALPHLENAYKNWRRLLKPGGILINFDADYCREAKAEQLPQNHAHKNIGARLTREYEHMKEELRPVQKPRPAWDRELLEAAGLQNIEIDMDAWKRVYADYDEFYNPTPIFAIKAEA